MSASVDNTINVGFWDGFSAYFDRWSAKDDDGVAAKALEILSKTGDKAQAEGWTDAKKIGYVSRLTESQRKALAEKIEAMAHELNAHLTDPHKREQVYQERDAQFTNIANLLTAKISDSSIQGKINSLFTSMPTPSQKSTSSSPQTEKPILPKATTAPSTATRTPLAAAGVAARVLSNTEFEKVQTEGRKAESRQAAKAPQLKKPPKPEEPSPTQTSRKLPPPGRQGRTTRDQPPKK